MRLNRICHAAPVARSVALAMMLVAVGIVPVGGKKHKERQFIYEGGTEQMPKGCEGNLEIGSTALTFRCASDSISATYSSISLMQYRSEISRLLKMNLAWKVKPKPKRSRQNQYFAVLYYEGGSTRAMVLDVTPEILQPYLAEIDLKSGKRVEVQSHEDYSQ
jgi:hypothetical protein